jgi:hypothetical protein
MHPVKKGKSYDDEFSILPVNLLQCISLFDPLRLFNHIPGCVSVCVCSVSSSKYLCACVDKGLQVKVTFYLKKIFPKNQNGLVCPFVDFLFHHFYFNYFGRLENGDRKNVWLFSHTHTLIPFVSIV